MNQDPQTIRWWPIRLMHFTIEKILSWQFIVLLAFLIFLGPMKSLLTKTEQIKVGEFQITVNKIAESFGIANVIKDIEDLSYDELKIFLVVGGEDANYYIFSPNNLRVQIRFYALYSC
jgi:hypothetical protein